MSFDVLGWVLNLLVLQGVLGGLDTLYHHELTVGLAMKPSARRELCIHALRASLYAVVFAALAWLAFHGAWVWVIAGLILLEVGLTLWDFVIEDASRKLPATERVLHTVLAINGGAVFGLYAWQLVQWHALESDLVLVDHGWHSIVLSVLALGVFISGLRDAHAAWRMSRRPARANAFAGLPHQRVLVTGGTGFIGEALLNQLVAAGHAVTVLTRRPLDAAYLFQGRVRSIASLAQLHAAERFDVVINLAGAPVIGPRWSPARKAVLLASRMRTTDALLAWLARAEQAPAVWVQASAIGFYGVRPGDELLSERSAAGSGFMSELCQRWEARAGQAGGVRQVVLRLGLVFGHGGALPPLLLPYRLGVGGRVGSGAQVMSWIHLDDVLALIARSIVDPTLRGVYNAVAPEAVSQAEFASMVGGLLGRPVWLALPAGLLRRVLGEMAQLLVDGQRVSPQRLLAQGYVFRYATLREALGDLL
ncbi:TIGR01777 family oxidoreductase [Jeongeupia wiesaeckerbachi]|uniref:TIGR01777 family oxidoreductase n=1 Tax=Jeongeupia wiesaeckerbachi TaxID=3051218 RepID=UPI003D807CF7